MRTHRVILRSYAGAAALFIGLLWIPAAHAAPSARSLALSGSLVAGAYGLDAADVNPAGVYVQGGHQLDLFALSSIAHNNSFTISDYNRYSGAYLTTEDKNYLLDRIPESGFRMDAEAAVHAASVWYSPIAVTIGSEGHASGTLSHDAAELLLFGNSGFDSVSLSGTAGTSYLTAHMGVSFAQPLAELAGGSLRAGGTLRVVKGLWVEEVTESNGALITSVSGLDGEARLMARTAEGGTGFAADLGAMYDIGGWQLGASVTNVIGSISWSGSPEAYVFTFEADSVTVLRADDEGVIRSHDTTYAIPAFSTRLPATLRLGAARQSGSLLLLGQWEQGLSSTSGGITSPRFSGGAEFWATRILPVRGGLSIGGGGGIGATAGSGVHTGMFFFDVGMGLASGPTWGAAKGFQLAVNTGFRF